MLSPSFVSDSLQPHGLYVAHQAPLSTTLSRQEYWSLLPYPPSGDLPSPGMEPRSPALRAECLPSEPTGKPVNPGVGSLSLLQGIFLTQEINLGSPALWADSLPSEPPGNPKNTGVGSLSLLQGIFLTQI